MPRGTQRWSLTVDIRRDLPAKSCQLEGGELIRVDRPSRSLRYSGSAFKAMKQGGGEREIDKFEKSQLGNRANVTWAKVTEHSKLHSSFIATYCKIRYKFFSCFVVIGKGQVFLSLVLLIKTKYLQILDNSFLHFFNEPCQQKVTESTTNEHNYKLVTCLV